MNFHPGLYVVSTPIGNLADITYRAIETLQKSDIILCEDPRVSYKLLSKYDISKKLLVHNDHSTIEDMHYVSNLIKDGNIISLISDAGTPLISDPGYKLIRYLHESNIPIYSVPGPSSPIAALSISGIGSDKIYFGGFLPKTPEGKAKTFKELENLNATLIFFETAPRLCSSLIVLQETLGNREICIARELTKLYQEIKLDTVANILGYYKDHSLKGEIVLIIARNDDGSREEIEDNLTNMIETSLSEGNSAKTTTDMLYSKFSNHYTKQELYKLVNDTKQQL